MTTIWRFEKRFRDACSGVLDETIKLLGCELPHQVFLIGVHTQTNDVTIIPDDSVVTAYQLAEELHPISESYVPFPDDNALALADAEWHRLFQKHDLSCWECWGKIHDALASILEGSDWAIEMSQCNEVNGYVVCLVALYSHSGYNRYPSLTRNAAIDSGKIPSLHLAAIGAVLDRFADDLRKRDAGGRYEIFSPNARDALRRAGAFFTRSNTWAGVFSSPLDGHFLGSPDFFDACNIISALPYESRVGAGRMLVADVDNRSIDIAVCFQPSIVVTEYKRVRKLLEMCRSGMHLLSSSQYVWGVGTLKQSLNHEADIFQIEFVGHYQWELWHLDKRLMTVKNGEPRLPTCMVDPGVLDRSLRRKFPNITNAGVAKLGDVATWASNQRHGTTVIISTNAASESKRLSSNSGVVPFTPDEATIIGSTSVDGALMLDMEGKCHGMGLILDGYAGEGESPSRGARYNSAVRYTRNRDDCLAVVVSVDGIVDILP